MSEPEPGSWRASAAPIIAKVIAEVGRDDIKALRKALRDAYPWHERRMWPYKVWCSEVRHQLFGKPARKRPDGLSPRDDQTLDMFAP